MNRILARRLSATVVCLAASTAVAQTADLAELLRERVERLRSASELRIDGTSIAAVRLIPALYERRNFQPTWTDAKAVDDLFGVLRRIHEHGLDGEDYHLPVLERIRSDIASGRASDVVLADYDILLTDSLARLGYHLYFGKVDPEDLDADWNLGREFEGEDPVGLIQDAIDSGSPGEAIEDLAPTHPLYGRLKSALARYREIRDRGGWEPVPAGPTLKPGMEDSRVVALRRRLAATGDLAARATSSPSFDEELTEAVVRFQTRYGLDADGLVGPGTLEALNVSVEERIGQLRISLERGRWVLAKVKGDLVLVNIAGFEAYLLKDGKIAWRTRAQVGKPYRKSPVFKGTMKYMVFNPTWTVPPGILAKDMLPKAKKDPGYLRGKNINVVDRNGRVVDPDSLDWASFSARNFPYQLVQAPGPNNALGRVKFIFPNPHFVFLHDTPSKGLFDRSERAFSSGCIRIENPFELAELLLDDDTKWNAEAIQKTVDSKKTKTVFLPEPLPVLVLYWTAWQEEDGTIHFRKDVYQRDGAILDALDGEFVFRPPEGLVING